MKYLITLLFLFTFTVSAQEGMPNMNLPGIDQANMPEMMKSMQKMSACMSKIKQAELKRIENIARKQNAALQKLCAAGKRDAAEKKGIEFGETMLKDPITKKINKCQEFMVGQIPTGAGMENDDDLHICDQFTNQRQY